MPHLFIKWFINSKNQIIFFKFLQILFLHLGFFYISIIVLLILISCILRVFQLIQLILVSLPNLAIGDREFYINDTARGYGYEGYYYGNFLFPFVLKNYIFN